jgi:hypothetical protein
MLTEAEAKTKWCPFARVGGGQGMDGSSYNRIEHHGGDISHTVATCLGSACMAWRWQAGTFEDYGRMMAKNKSGYVVVATGHCGLAGASQ